MDGCRWGICVGKRSNRAILACRCSGMQARLNVCSGFGFKVVFIGADLVLILVPSRMICVCCCKVYLFAVTLVRLQDLFMSIYLSVSDSQCAFPF